MIRSLEIKTVVATAATVFFVPIGGRLSLARQQVSVSGEPVTCHMSYGVGEV